METVVRVAIVYVLILAMLRVMGKRELAQLTPVELVMLILVPELVAQSLVREDFSMINGIVAVTTLMSLVFITSALSFRYPRFSEIVEGKPSMLAEHGHSVRSTMDLERITPEGLASAMREAGIERLADVKWAVLEPGGRISFIKYEAGDVAPDDDQRRV